MENILSFYCVWEGIAVTGCLKFIHWFDHLNEERQKKFLRDVFMIHNVSVYSVFVREQSVFFRVFGDNVFYQFVFELEEFSEKGYVDIFNGERICNYFIFTGNYFKKDKYYSFDILTYIFLTVNRGEFDWVFHQFL